MNSSNAANRLDRLPISRLHKIMLAAVSFAYFFEFADINTFATTVPKLVKLWGVTVTQIAYVTSASFIGMFFGSLIGGWIADRWGRKNALTITTVWFAIFSFVSVFSWDVVSLGVLRVLTSAGLAAMTVVAVIYINEMYPAAVRGKYQAYAIVIGICGTPATNLIASFVVPLNDWSWRLVYLWGSLGFLSSCSSCGISTSHPRWLREQRANTPMTDAVLTDIETRVAVRKRSLLPHAPPDAVATPPTRKAQLRFAAAEEVLRSDSRALRAVGNPDHRLLRVLELGANVARPRGDERGEVDLLRRPHDGGRAVGVPARRATHRPLRAQVAARHRRCGDRGQRTASSVLTFNPIMIVGIRVHGQPFRARLHRFGLRVLAGSVRHPDAVARHLGVLRAGAFSNAAGPLIIAALYNGSGYRSVFMFIAGTWLFGAIVLAVFGPRTRRALEHPFAEAKSTPTTA